MGEKVTFAVTELFEGPPKRIIARPVAVAMPPPIRARLATVSKVRPVAITSSYLGSVQAFGPQPSSSSPYLLLAMLPVTANTAMPARPTPATTKPAVRTPPPLLGARVGVRRGGRGAGVVSVRGNESDT